MSASLFPSLHPYVALHRSAAQDAIVVRDGQSDEGDLTPSMSTVFAAEGYVVDFLGRADGVTPLDDIISDLVEEYGQGFGPSLARSAATWAVQRQDIVRWSDRPFEHARRPLITGSKDGFYPLHATVEIIETCNFTCDHCYYQSSPLKKGKLTLSEAEELFAKLARNGVRVIELTGGECTIHPNFREILKAASETFEMVAIISNGYKLGSDRELMAFVCAIPNLVVQISIDAIAATHDAFRKHKGSFTAAVKAAHGLVEAGKVVRLASSISAETVEEVLPLYRLGKELGVARHSFAPVSSIGRGCNVTDPSSGARELVDAINAQLTPYADDPMIRTDAGGRGDDDEAEEPRNCGAGWRTVAIDYEGDVRACNFSRDSKKFGNVLREDYGDIFEQPAQFMFQNAPSPGGVDCTGCQYYHYCQGCFVKAFTLSETTFPACKWRQRWFPGMALRADDQRHIRHSLAEKRAMVPRYKAADSARPCGSCACSASHSATAAVP